MKVKTFIDRPLLSMVISVIIVALGVIALTSLPVERYPDIAPPAINVWASYPGASAETVLKSVVTPLEEAINGVDGMTYMKSSASNGSGSITVFFEQGANADLAAVNVQNRVIQAQTQLPAEVLQIGVSTEKQQPGQLRIIALESPNGTYDENFLSNYFYNNLRPAILRIKGVGKVEVWGSQYALRIWLKPDVMARYKLMPSDISAVLAEQNIEASVGALGQNSDNVFQYVLRYTGRKTEVSEFENLVIASLPTGEELHLKDVADIELGQSDYDYANSINSHPGVMGSVHQVAGSNATKINLAIDKLLDELSQKLPKDVKIVTFDNTNDFLFASIREVIITLLIAMVLVLVVVFLFLQDFRATLIPALGILVSLIGTFAFMKVAGFSVNLLTLFALVLVIGTVVDDSIVVVEAVKANFDAGYKSAYKAAVDAMKGLAVTLFTTTLVFMVIFIPVSFMGGTTGIFFKQFGLTMAVAVGISFINALTLAPALCALLLKPSGSEGSFTKKVTGAYDTAFQALLGHYLNVLKHLIKRKKLVAVSVVTALALVVLLFKVIPTGFVPNEDVGTLFVDITAPSGYTMEKTRGIMDRACEQIQQLPTVESVGGVVGVGAGSNGASIFVQLKPWKQRRGRNNSSTAVMEQISEIMSQEREAQAFVMEPGMIEGYGGGGGFEFSVQDRNGTDIRTLKTITDRFVEKLTERPEIGEIYSNYDVNYPQYKVDVEVSHCKRAGISPVTVLNELGAYLGGDYISNFNKYNKVYQVSLQLRPSDRTTPESLDNLFVRSESGAMLPISQFVTLTKEFMPQSLSNFNMFSSIGVSGNVAPGSSTGKAIKSIQELAAKELPVGYTIEFDGITREESQQGNRVIVIFIICLVFVYLVMVALYESLFIPLAVMLAVPFGLVGSLLFAKIFGVENNIYFQVGIIMLMGLLAKTAILLTEYASQNRREGMSITDSAFVSAKMRLRPVLMTSLTMIFGMLPLMFANGVGANGSRTIGVCLVGGMLFGTLGLLLTVPGLFTIFQKIQEKVRRGVPEGRNLNYPRQTQRSLGAKKMIVILLISLSANTLPAQSWQQIYPDPLLQSYISEALENNADLRTAQLSLEQSVAMLKQARLSYLPAFSLAPSGTVSKAQNEAATYTYELPLTMSWELSFGGKQHHQKEMAIAELEKDSAQLKYAQIQLIAEVANAYYTLVMLDKQYAITLEGIRVQEENLRVLRAMKEVGQQNETAVSQAEASYQGVLTTLPMLEAQIRKAESALCLLLNRQPDTIARAPWEEVKGIVMDTDRAIPLEALASRPDVLAAECLLRASFSNVKVARAEFYPTLSISGSAGWTNNGVTINPNQILLNAISSLTQPLFAQGRLKANLKVAQSQQEQAQIAFEKALLVAGGEVRDALADCRACRTREEARTKQVEAAQRAYENSRLTMQYANTSYLEVLIAQSAWLDAQLQQTADWLELQQGKINLYKALCQ
ncbi:MAG: efflux RND transporter permease subunit [Bacteroidales bacterium]|nr:efflux RND transporter permease subunit [Bacteroidales bacterium]